jgi:hypothetical protein
MSDEQTPPDLISRIERLEKANRVWKTLTLCLAPLLVVFGSIAAYFGLFVQPAQGQNQPAPQFQTKVDSLPSAYYFNFVRVTGTPEELMLDLALSNQIGEVAKEPIKFEQRVVMNFYTAKRLLGALQLAIQRHEEAYGVLEIDVMKRAKRP